MKKITVIFLLIVASFQAQENKCNNYYIQDTIELSQCFSYSDDEMTETIGSFRPTLMIKIYYQNKGSFNNLHTEKSSPYSFDTENVKKKIKVEYDIDLSILDYTNALRKENMYPHQNLQPMYYIISEYASENSVNKDGYDIETRFYKIDGKTGEILKIMERVFVKNFVKLEQINEEIYAVHYGLWRKYEMSNTDELLKITEYEKSVNSCGIFSFKALDYDYPQKEKVIYERSGNKEGASEKKHTKEE